MFGCQKRGALFVVARITGCLAVQIIEQKNVAAIRNNHHKNDGSICGARTARGTH
jgi:glucose dehydrogenase